MANLVQFLVDTNVNANATDIQNSAAVPSGRVARVIRVGGFEPSGGFIAIQWGSGGTFVTVRAGSGSFNMELNHEFTGDGVKFFRLVRKNGNALAATQIVAWADIIVLD